MGPRLALLAGPAVCAFVRLSLCQATEDEEHIVLELPTPISAELKRLISSEAHTNIVPEWKQGAVSWRRSDGSNIVIGKLAKGVWKWHETRLATVLPNLSFKELSLAGTDAGAEEW